MSVIDTCDAGTGKGFDYFRDELSRVLVPMDIRCPTPGEFRARHRSSDLGAVTLVSIWSRPHSHYEIARTPPMITRSDPGAYRLLVNLTGSSDFLHHGRYATLRPGGMALFDTSFPFFGRRWPGPDSTGRSFMATFPYDALPFTSRQVRTLLGARLPTQAGAGALVRAVLEQIGALREPQAAEARRLSAALLDLLVVHLAEQLDVATPAAHEAGAQTTWLRVQAFIAEHLGDPDLSTERVATAHHMSVRTLQRLFASHDTTVAAWIRTQRLERVRHDLLDHRLATTPVRTIARRRGFLDQAHFTRAFRRAYGSTPLAYRASATRR